MPYEDLLNKFLSGCELLMQVVTDKQQLLFETKLLS